MAEEKSLDQYHVWVTALLSSYEKGIVHGLVNKGYTVSPADFTGSISYTYKGAAASVVAVKVQKTKIVPTELMDNVKDILAGLNAKYFSVVVSKFTEDCTWFGTNIVIPADTQTEIKAVDKKSN